MRLVAVAEQFPRFIEIQTTSACNAACVVCPHAETIGGQPRGRMTLDLFRSIIDQCIPHQRGLTIAPYLNAEPLLDVRLAERLEYIRARCPDAKVELSTNVSMLNEKWRSKLAAQRIDDLRLSVFGFTPATHVRLMPGLDFDTVMTNLRGIASDGGFRSSLGVAGVVLLDHPAVTEEDVDAAERYCAETGFELYRWDVLDRSRNVANYSNGVWRDVVTGCEQRRHLERLHIRVDGAVIMCCQDWRSEIVLGDVVGTKISDLWHSEAYQQIRELIESGIPGAAPELCRRCKISVGL